jgi:hypothetical protein
MFVWSICQQVRTRATTSIPPIILEAHVPKMGEQAYEDYGKPQQANYFNQVI